MKALKFLFSLLLTACYVGSVFATGGVSLMTVPSAGNFDCAALLEILGKADQMWVDNAVKKDYMPKADALVTIINNQTAKLSEISGQQSKNHKIKMTWVNACDLDIEDCGNECDFDGTELSVDCKEYEPTLCKEANFKVNEITLRDTIYSPEEIVARGFLKAKKQLDEYLAQQLILFINANKGENQYAGIGTIVGSGIGGQTTNISSAAWTASLMGEFYQSSIINKMANPYLLSGSNLFQSFWNAQANTANADGKGDLNKFEQIPINFDLFNVDSVNSPALITYLLDKGALAFGSKNYYGSTPTVYAGQDYQQRYSISSSVLPGVSYDVHYTTKCNDSGQMTHHFKVIARGGIYLNPAGCTQENNGIIAYKKV